jgi:glycosyltransferase involved in cell wall biosynthesis
MRLSTIIPVYNAERTLGRTLASLRAPDGHEMEVIVVDDGSTDRSASIAEAHGCKVIRMQGNRGPSAARNRGAQEASGEVFVFTDADIEFLPDTLDRIVGHFLTDPHCAALVGNLTPTGEFENFLSAYKNLYTHFSFKDSGPYLTVVYTSITAVRAAAFREAGGFPDVYPNEDRIFGLALTAKGHRIRFDNAVQVRHHRTYRPTEFIAMEVERSRTIMLMTLEARVLKRWTFREHIPSTFKAASVLAAVAGAGIVAAPVSPPLLLVSLAALAGIAWVLRSFFSFIASERGALFCCACYPLLVADLFLCLAGATWGVWAFLKGDRIGGRL